MNNYSSPSLERYAKLMIEKINEVNDSDWVKPWFTNQFKGVPQNFIGRPYSGFNKTILYLICDKFNYQTPVFITFYQAANENINITKGMTSFPITFYEFSINDKITGEKITRELYNNLSKAEQGKYKVIPFLKYYNVFNLDQTNFAEKYPEKWTNLKKQFEVNEVLYKNGYRNPLIDKTIEKQSWVCPIKVEKQSRAFYSQKENSITLPLREYFSEGKNFYYTALHEMAHSTGHPERLARKFGYFGTAQYAHEELIAELSSAVAGRDLGFTVLPRKENAQYIKSWLAAITNDPKYLFSILQDVNKAVTMIEEGIGLTKELEKSSTVTNETSIPVLTEDEYLSSKGYRDSFYSEPAMHKGIQKTANQQNKLVNLNIRRSQQYFQERTAVKHEYQTMIEKGEIREPTRIERIIKSANGHPDLESTHAARRIAMAQGIAWQSENGMPIISQYYLDNQQVYARFYQDGNMYERMVWNNKNDYILCTGARSQGNYTEHILPPEEVMQIQSLKASRIEQSIEIQNCDSKTLLGDISTSPGIEPQVSNYRIHDKSTGKTEILDVSDIDLSKQSSESIKGLLSGKQVEITNKSGAVQMMGLNKTATGWSLKIGKQAFSVADSGAEL